MPTKKTRLVAIGACAVDHILTVPHFPEEDSKLRATSFNKRIGGNTPNTFNVLQQLVTEDCMEEDLKQDGLESLVPELFLIVTLPAQDCAQTKYITSSFNNSLRVSEASNTLENGSSSCPRSHSPRVDLSHCIYREDFIEPVSAYIVSSQATSLRTIINHNALPEMTFDEFVDVTPNLLDPSSAADNTPISHFWFHFEGRIPSTTLDCIRHLRTQSAFNPASSQISDANVMKLKISVELEKPSREGLQDLAHEADVIFYSKAWARGEGYESAEECLRRQAEILANQNEGLKMAKTLICTWGENGASALVLQSGSNESQRSETYMIQAPAYICPDKPIVDSIGAGDTFIAGVLFGFVCRTDTGEVVTRSWSLKQTLSFANGLAGRKILQDGFRGLGESSRDLRRTIELEGG